MKYSYKAVRHAKLQHLLSLTLAGGIAAIALPVHSMLPSTPVKVATQEEDSNHDRWMNQLLYQIENTNYVWTPDELRFYHEKEPIFMRREQPNAQNEQGRPTLLHEAVVQRSRLRGGVVLDNAIQNNILSLARVYITLGVDPNVRNEDGETALDIVKRTFLYPDPRLVAILQAPTHVTTPPVLPPTGPVLVRARGEQVPREGGTTTNNDECVNRRPSPSMDHWTPEQHALYDRERHQFIDGTQPNPHNEHGGTTLLHIATAENEDQNHILSLVEIYIALGVDPNVRNGNNHTALDIVNIRYPFPDPRLVAMLKEPPAPALVQTRPEQVLTIGRLIVAAQDRFLAEGEGDEVINDQIRRIMEVTQGDFSLFDENLGETVTGGRPERIGSVIGVCMTIRHHLDEMVHLEGLLPLHVQLLETIGGPPRPHNATTGGTMAPGFHAGSPSGSI